MQRAWEDTGQRLLVVDDEPAVRTLFCHVLKMGGFRVFPAASGEEALQLIDGGLSIDLILLDYRMPGLNGGDTLKQLRARGITAPAILVSAIHSTSDTPTKLGFDASVEKPCSAKELLATVHATLSGTFVAQPTEAAS